ncbi:GNAT family N-acetyltransferase [Planktothrix pseudagardhii]|uniref:GCN5-related N-acetyltransferase n=1 Tax=Planktothrix pseudagardhii TaxID=132604 RepID=A0A9W4CGU4_9CYAN|nr:GNAT family N-acetyltransferase [Planktothrix pseudagardhii]CAD5912425.1 GCN5-related N-acetyltransferase [Planktothrix pseudagardhii]
MTSEKINRNSLNIDLPDGCVLRPATPQDSLKILWLVLKDMLDPTQLRWQQFWVIESHKQIIACGQLRQFTDVEELGSLVVSRAWRGKSLGAILVEHLIQESTKPLYLECLGQNLANFYTRFGFIPVDFSALPTSIKPKFGISNWAKILLKIPVIFMYRREQGTGNRKKQSSPYR